MSKFHYEEKIRIISGFYKGTEAVIVNKRFWFYKIDFGDYERCWVPCWHIESSDPKFKAMEFNNKLDKIIK